MIGGQRTPLAGRPQPHSDVAGPEGFGGTHRSVPSEGTHRSDLRRCRPPPGKVPDRLLVAETRADHAGHVDDLGLGINESQGLHGLSDRDLRDLRPSQ